MLVGFIVSMTLLVLLASIVIPTGNLGTFERKRRAREQADGDDIEIDREIYYGDILSLKRAFEALLLVVTAAFSVAFFGWLFGVIIALVVALEYGAIARIGALRKFMMKQYGRIERQLHAFIHQHENIMKFVKVALPEPAEMTLHSRDELIHLIDTSVGVLDVDEKKLLRSAVVFRDQQITEYMTPRSMIESINKVELLGPLVLDELHKKGFSRYPVIENDVDHVVGILHLRDVLHVETNKKHTSKVETAMEKKVFYIHEAQTLEHALKSFIATRHHLFIVVNEYRETVGLLSLEDVVEALIGQKIVDEFDQHTDLRSVAARNPRKNNSSFYGKDV